MWFRKNLTTGGEGEQALLRATKPIGGGEEQTLFRAIEPNRGTKERLYRRKKEGYGAGGGISTLGILILLGATGACAVNIHAAMFEGHLGISCGTTEKSVVLIV